MTVKKSSRVVTSNGLTTCGVVKKGQAIHLGFIDDIGEATSIEFPFDQALSLIMTLPHLIGRAATLQTKDPTACCVFSLKQWTLERVGSDGLILTLSTSDGFAVSFSVPLDTCKALGFALRHESGSASEEPSDMSPINPVVLN